jgi:hypothetical protein
MPPETGCYLGAAFPAGKVLPAPPVLAFD